MTLKEWKSLQNEFGFKIIDADYEIMTVEKGRKLLEALKNNFEDIYNDEKEKMNNDE